MYKYMNFFCIHRGHNLSFFCISATYLEEIAAELGDRSLANSTVVEKAMLFTTAGMFLEAQLTYRQIQKDGDWIQSPSFCMHISVYASLWIASPERSFGSNHVVFGGMMLPESAMSTSCFMETG